MKGDFSRLRFSPGKNYTSVLSQQGRVSLDADSNEQCAINDYLRTTQTMDVVGPVGGPKHDEGFKITVSGGDAIKIGKGRYYVEGILCENDQPLLYAEQPYLIGPNPTDQALLASLQQGSIGGIQVYLEVWRRLVIALDDPCLREPALGLADTTARVQTVWRVVAKGRGTGSTNTVSGTLTLLNGSAQVSGSGTAFTTDLSVGQQLRFAADPSQTLYTVNTIANDTNLTLNSNFTGAASASTTASAVEATGSCCDSMHTGLVRERNPGKLSAQTGGSSGDCSCQPTPAAGYLGLENQLYRVEIHQSGDAATATFKWSRDNGSVVSAVTGVSGCQVYVDSLGPDPNLGFSPWQWVEISDDSNLFGQNPNQPGDLYQIQSINPQTLSLTMTQPVAFVDPTKNARMRRWDQFGSSAGPNGIGLSEGSWLTLENGIQVEFGKGNYHSGDHWLIPARTATGNIEWPPCNSDGNAFQPAYRTEIFLAPLACIQWDSQKQAVQIKDCRKSFYPLTELAPSKTASCCTYRVGDGGDYSSIQTAIDALPDEGGEVCILPGRYFENVRIVGRRDVVIHGCGWQTRVASRSLQGTASGVSATADTLNTAGAVNPVGAVFTIVASEHIQLRSFAVEAADDEAGILVDGTGTSLSTDANVALNRIILKPRAVRDITIEDMVLTAATFPAVLAVHVELLRIDRNRIAMKNVASMWQAIYASGKEIHIDRNWVGIQSAANDREWLPSTVSGDFSSSTAATNPPSASATASGSAVGTEQSVGILKLTTLELPRHPGGIQIGGISTDVYILENEIEGGSRNGITLGSFDILDTKGNTTGLWAGSAITAEPDDCDCTGTLLTSPSYPGTTGYKVVAGGILTNIQIHRNRIREMGLCGIGPVGYFNLLETLEIITTVVLNISGNEITRTLLRDLADSAKAIGSIGYGAICVPDVQDLIVRDNMITDFGAKPGVDVCGIFVLHGEMVEISRNQVLETRDWTKASEEKTTASEIARGGIVVYLGTPLSFREPLDESLWIAADQKADADALRLVPVYEPGIPAVRVEHNIVRVPLSSALAILGLGPFSIVNNHLGCGGLVRTTTEPPMVLIMNMGAAIDSTIAAYRPSSLASYAVDEEDVDTDTGFRNVSCGTVLFSNNICQLEAAAARLTEYASVEIFTADHLNFSNNVCWLDDLRRSARVNAVLFARTLNVVGNRFQESSNAVTISGLTLGRLNITQQNISTHCLIAVGHKCVKSDNIALSTNTDPCLELEKMFTKLFE